MNSKLKLTSKYLVDVKALITKIIIEIIQNIVTVKKLFKYFKLIVNNILNWYKIIFF